MAWSNKTLIYIQYQYEYHWRQSLSVVLWKCNQTN